MAVAIGGIGRASGAARTAAEIGRAGEDAVRGVANIGPKVVIEINGRNRIPYGLTAEALTEVKNVQCLALTRQIRDYLDYADKTGRELHLWVREDTRLTGPLLEFIRDNGINVRDIPK